MPLANRVNAAHEAGVDLTDSDDGDHTAPQRGSDNPSPSDGAVPLVPPKKKTTAAEAEDASQPATTDGDGSGTAAHPSAAKKAVLADAEDAYHAMCVLAKHDESAMLSKEEIIYANHGKVDLVRCPALRCSDLLPPSLPCLVLSPIYQDDGLFDKLEHDADFQISFEARCPLSLPRPPAA